MECKKSEAKDYKLKYPLHAGFGHFNKRIQKWLVSDPLQIETFVDFWQFCNNTNWCKEIEKKNAKDKNEIVQSRDIEKWFFRPGFCPDDDVVLPKYGKVYSLMLYFNDNFEEISLRLLMWFVVCGAEQYPSIIGLRIKAAPYGETHGNLRFWMEHGGDISDLKKITEECSGLKCTIRAKERKMPEKFYASVLIRRERKKEKKKN